MTYSPLISVIIPVYNAQKYLHRCVDSVLAQTYKNLEIILIDDGSTDGSAQICDKYAAEDKRVQVIHQANTGVSVARNAGLQSARGQYIGFVDADDYIEGDMYSYLHNLIVFHHVDIAVCNVCQTVRRKRKLRLSADIPSLMTGKQAVWNFMNSFFLCNKLFAAHLFQDHHFDPGITYCEDKLLLLPIFFQTNYIAYGAIGKYHYILNATGCTAQFSIKHFSFFAVQDKLIAFARENDDGELASYLERQKIGFSVRCLRLIAQSNYNNANVIDQLLERVKRNLWQYIGGRASLIRKVFAICCCINFNLARRIYILLQGHKK